MNTYHLVAGWLGSHPYVLWALGAALVFGLGWLFHWWVLDVRYWFRPYIPDPIVLPGPEDWEDLDADAQADQLIAEWHDDEPRQFYSEPRIVGPVPSFPPGPAWLDDPDLIVWDAKQQAARCWEILHVDFPRLRIELGIAA